MNIFKILSKAFAAYRTWGHHANRGFSLIELMIVLIIAGLLTGAALQAYTVYMSKQKQEALQGNLDTVRAALSDYVRDEQCVIPDDPATPADEYDPAPSRAQCISAGYGHLANEQTKPTPGTRNSNFDAVRFPCPADPTLPPNDPDFGLEQCDDSVSGVVEDNGVLIGSVPFRTLGISSRYIKDPHGNRLTYAVTEDLTLPGAMSGGNSKQGRVDLVNADGNPISPDARFGLLSHGENGEGAYTWQGTRIPCGGMDTGERENCDEDATFRYQEGFTQGTGDYYDDTAAFTLVDNNDTGWWFAPNDKPTDITHRNSGNVIMSEQGASKVGIGTNAPIGKFHVAGGNALVETSVGIGVGVDNPFHPLHAFGEDSARLVIGTRGDDSGDQAGISIITEHRGSPNARLRDSSTSGWNISGRGASHTNNLNDMIFSYCPGAVGTCSQYVNIDHSTGFVGIGGVGDPQGTVDINGNLRVYNDVSSSLVMTTGNQTGGGGGFPRSVIYLVTAGSPSAAGYGVPTWALGARGESAGAQGGDFYLTRESGNGNPDNKKALWIDADTTNVGMNVIDPLERLHVRGDKDNGGFLVDNPEDQAVVRIAGAGDNYQTYSGLYLDDQSVSGGDDPWIMAHKTYGDLLFQKGVGKTAALQIDGETDNVGLGAAPSQRLHVRGNKSSKGLLVDNQLDQAEIHIAGQGGTDNTHSGLYLDDQSVSGGKKPWIVAHKTDGRLLFQHGIGGTVPFALDSNGNGWIYNDLTVDNLLYSSDVRLKEGINNIGEVLPALEQLRTIRYVLKDDPAKEKRLGVIAQEVEKDFPELVNENKDGYKSVDYPQLTVPLISAVQELNQQNKALRAELANLRSEYSERLARLEMATGLSAKEAGLPAQRIAFVVMIALLIGIFAGYNYRKRKEC